MADIDTPIFRPEQYTHTTDRMTAELYQIVLDLRQEVHELRLAVVEMNRRQLIQAKMQDLSFTDCLAHAWNEIKDRRGKMVDGVFVKEVGNG